MIPDDIVDRVRSGTDIVELVSEYVSLKKTGANYIGLCPFHPEKTPSFTVSPSKQIFHCFGCGAGGDVFSFLMRQGNYIYPEAIRKLADRAGIIIPETVPARGRSREEYEALQAVNDEAAGFFVSCLRESREGEKARQYLKGREMSDEAAAEFGIGYSLPLWDGLLKYLEKKGVKPELAEKAGLAIRKTTGLGHYDRFRDRVMFPIKDIRGRCIGFGGRTMGDETPKYLNSPETPLFKKGETLYGIDIASESIRKKDYAIVVEGYFDVIACHRAGLRNAVATLGTALTPAHLRLLGRFSKNVLVVFDSDAAGIKAAERSLDIFLGSPMTPKVALLPVGDDPDSLFKREGKAGLTKCLTPHVKLMDFVLARLAEGANTIEEKMEAVARLTGILARMENSVERGYYLKKAAESLAVEESDLKEELHKKTSRTGVYKTVSLKKPAAGQNRIEEGLVHALLHHPELAGEVSGMLAPEDFTDERLRAIAAKVFELLESEGTVDVPRLLSRLEGDAEKELVRSLSMKEVVEDPKGFMDGAVGNILESRYKRTILDIDKKTASFLDNDRERKELSDIRLRMGRALSTKDFALLNKLTKEFIEWQKRKSSTK